MVERQSRVCLLNDQQFCFMMAIIVIVEANETFDSVLFQVADFCQEKNIKTQKRHMWLFL